MKEDTLYDVWTYDGMKKAAVCKEDYTYITSFFGTQLRKIFKTTDLLSVDLDI